MIQVMERNMHRNRVETIVREKEKKEIIEKLILLQKKPSEKSDVPVPVALVAFVGIACIGKTKLAHLVCEDERIRHHFGYPVEVDGIHDEAFDVESIAERVTESAARGRKRHIMLLLDDLRADIRDESLIAKLLIKLSNDGVSVGAILVTTRNRGFLPKNTHVLHLNSSPLGAELNYKKLLLDKLKPIYYDNLPPHHKQCFAYASLFPKNYSFDTDRLIHLWMAEGFIETSSSDPSLSPEEIGRQYLNDFVDRCIFQDEDGVVRRCKMNPWLFDLARFVAKGENISINMDPYDVYGDHEVLRASFDFSLPFQCQIPSFLFEKVKKLNTILLKSKGESLLLPQDQVKMSETTCDKIFTTFKRLRVLDLHDLGIKTVPSSIGKLKEVRYLDLSHNNMEKLPGSITKLSKLQTLNLSQCHLLKELPKDLKNLSMLRHLDIEGCLSLTHMPLGTKTLTSLQTLSHFVVSKNNHMGGLDELAELNNLTGHLEILHLERLKFHTPSNYLKQKQHLQRLTLRWDQYDAEGSLLNKQKPLEILQPHQNLKVLHVFGYQGDKFSNWLSSLQCLVKFSLYNCPKCKFLPPMDQLPSLKILELRRLYSLKFIAENTNTLPSSSITTPTVQFFPSLKELTIWDCPNLESWWESTDDNVKRPIFSSISTLRVEHCPKLACLPLYPGLDEMLVLVNSSVKPMQDTINYDDKARETFIPFSKLKSMLIAGIEQSPPEEWLIKFTSLEKLHVRDCFHLESIPQGYKHLTSLEFLTIENCPILDLDSSSNEWEGLKNLHTLIMREIPKLKSLPSGLEKVTSLKELKLFDCHGLTSLPESIGNLTSLAKLVIYKCSKLDSLPKGLEKLKSLHTLTIMDCPLLLPRCQKETGDDWPQIAHIKNIHVNQTREDLGLQNSKLLL